VICRKCYVIVLLCNCVLWFRVSLAPVVGRYIVFVCSTALTLCGFSPELCGFFSVERCCLVDSKVCSLSSLSYHPTLKPQGYFDATESVN